MRAAVLLLLLALTSFAVSAAPPMVLDEKGVFRRGDFTVEIGPTGAVRVRSGAQEIAGWGCLFELEGAQRCYSLHQALLNPKRSVDAAGGVVTIEGVVQTEDKRSLLPCRQTVTASGDGVMIDVSFALPDGRDAMGVMQNRRRPFGLMTLGGDAYAGGLWKSRAHDGKEGRGAIPADSPATGTPNYVPDSGKIAAMSVWPPKGRPGIMVIPGDGCYVELLDFRRMAGVLRFNVHPDTDRSRFSQMIVPLEPLPLPPVSVSDATLDSPYDAYLFPAGRPAVFRLQITNNRAAEVRPNVEWTVEPWSGGAVLTGREQPVVAGNSTGKAAISVVLPRRDLYRFTARVTADGVDCGAVRFGLASVVPNPPLAEIRRTHFGLQGHELPGAAQVGLKWRLAVLPGWDRVEPEKGRFNWKQMDELMARFRQAEFTLIASVNGTPEWASSLRDRATFDDFLKKYAGDPAGLDAMVLACGGLKQIRVRFANHDAHLKSIPADWADYRRFLTEMTRRYPDQMKHIAVSNEIDGCNGYFGSPREYVEFLKQTWETAKAIDPGIKILGIGSYSGTPTPFARDVFAAGGAKYMDVYHWHPYYEGAGWDAQAREQFGLLRKYSPDAPGWATEFGNPAPPKVDSFPMSETEYFDSVKLAADGKPPSKFFTLGFGANTVKIGDRMYLAPNGPYAMPEAALARSLARFYPNHLAEGVDVFTIHSGTPIVNERREPYSTALAQAMASATLAEAVPVRRIASAAPTFRGFLFRVPAGHAAVCWSTAERQSVALKCGDGAQAADLYGNPVAVTPRNGVMTVELTDSPVYLTGVAADIAALDPVTGLNVEFPAAVAPGDAATVRVKFRNALTVPLAARIAATPPKGWTAAAPVDRTIAPAQEADETLVVTAPRDAAPGSGSVLVDIRCKAGDVDLTQSVRRAFLIVMPVSCPPAPKDFVLDGDLREWTGREPARIERNDQIVWQTTELLSQFNRLWRGPDDLSARVWYAWQPEALLVAMDAVDDDLQLFTTPEGREYLGDCVELFLDGRAGTYRTEYGKGVYQMLWTPPVKAGEAGRFAKGRNAEGVTFAARRTPKGYAVEFRIPLTDANFPGFKAAPGAIFGFTVALDDFDAGLGTSRKIQMALSGSGSNHLDTSGFLRLRFDERVFKTNLIENGDFLDGAPRPAGWRVTGGVVAPEGDGGKPCLRLERKGKDGALAAQAVTLEADRWYVLDFAWRRKGALGVSYVTVKPAEGGAFAPASYDLSSGDSAEWMRGALHFHSGRGGAAEIDVRAGLKSFGGDEALPAQGTLWLDHLVLRTLTAADLSGELVENGGFESGAPGDEPPGWARGRTCEKPPRLRLTDREAHSGKQSCEITVGPPQEIAGLDTFARASGSRRLTPDRKYVLRFWCKSDQQATLQVVVDGPVFLTRTFVARQEWSEQVIPVMVTAEQENTARRSRQATLSFEGPLKAGNVRFWLDDVSLKSDN